jgi:hypothetical protein
MQLPWRERLGKTKDQLGEKSAELDERGDALARKRVRLETDKEEFGEQTGVLVRAKFGDREEALKAEEKGFHAEVRDYKERDAFYEEDLSRHQQQVVQYNDSLDGYKRGVEEVKGDTKLYEEQQRVLDGGYSVGDIQEGLDRTKDEIDRSVQSLDDQKQQLFAEQRNVEQKLQDLQVKAGKLTEASSQLEDDKKDLSQHKLQMNQKLEELQGAMDPLDAQGVGKQMGTLRDEYAKKESEVLGREQVFGVEKESFNAEYDQQMEAMKGVNSKFAELTQDIEQKGGEVANLQYVYDEQKAEVDRYNRGIDDKWDVRGLELDDPQGVAYAGGGDDDLLQQQQQPMYENQGLYDAQQQQGVAYAGGGDDVLQQQVDVVEDTSVRGKVEEQVLDGRDGGVLQQQQVDDVQQGRVVGADALQQVDDVQQGQQPLQQDQHQQVNDVQGRDDDVLEQDQGRVVEEKRDDVVDEHGMDEQQRLDEVQQGQQRVDEQQRLDEQQRAEDQRRMDDGQERDFMGQVKVEEVVHEQTSMEKMMEMREEMKQSKEKLAHMQKLQEAILEEQRKLK